VEHSWIHAAEQVELDSSDEVADDACLEPAREFGTHETGSEQLDDCAKQSLLELESSAHVEPVDIGSDAGRDSQTYSGTMIAGPKLAEAVDFGSVEEMALVQV
jgi:hypothetical protein